jgi:hypothetical protein
VPFVFVDLAEIVEVEDGQGEPAVVSRRAEPLAFELFLEGAMVAETGQGVA